MDQDASNFPNPPANLNKPQRRRQLLPWWVVGFVWIFMVFGALMPIAIIMGLLHFNFQLSLLGLTTDQPMSLIGGSLIFLFLFKGAIGLALWMERAWAVKLAKVDAIISGLVCIGVMVYVLYCDHSLSLRLELIAIIPYYLKMNSIQYDWENFDYEEATQPVVDLN